MRAPGLPASAAAPARAVKALIERAEGGGGAQAATTNVRDGGGAGLGGGGEARQGGGQLLLQQLRGGLGETEGRGRGGAR